MADRASGLHDRLNRISHWDVNVTDLERSRSWYEATTTLRVVARTKASQSFPSFGIEFGSFKGYLLKDATLPHGVPMIHLVQWETPAPVGTPYRSQANVGWYRIVPIVEDIDAAREAVMAQGSEPFAPTTRAKVSFHPGGRAQHYTEEQADAKMARRFMSINLAKPMETVRQHPFVLCVSQATREEEHG